MGFEFRKRVVVVEIEGKRYSIEPTPAAFEKIKDYGDALQDLTKKNNVEGGEAEVLRLSKDALKCVLGEKVFGKITSGRELDVRDCIDLFNYLTETIKKHGAKTE